MNTASNNTQKLPEGWILCRSKSNPGRKYYFNKKTGKSSWTEPQAEEKMQPKQRSKKEKNTQEKNKEDKKTLKRKSDSKDDSLTRKKQKQETPTPERRKLTPSKTRTPVECSESHKNESPSKPTPAKNLANTRLAQLRSQLATEVQMSKPEESEKSPVKVCQKHKLSPKTPQHESQKVPRLELKSPISESKCSTTQSPSSDSLQSIPSPSQFFAANKIISSMKAQLPEEFCNKTKPKDTFADIEQGICNQTAEYPSMKHPATPPQFSEASKLVSAIKSKLSYKVSTKDSNLKTFSSAKERMEALRADLSNEAMNTKEIDSSFLCKSKMPKFINESMEVENFRETKHNLPHPVPMRDNVSSNENIELVVDTNIFIHELDVIKNVINSHIKGYSEQPTLLVPWRVINELDRLKDNNNGNGAICKRARAAMDYLYKSLPESNRIRGQSLRDANSHIYPCELPDDEILNCCLQQADRGKSVILLSNDKNLCNKAAINGVKCIGLDKLRPLLENKPEPASDPELYASLKHYENTMFNLLANILENEMRAKYNNLWLHVLFKAPPWTLPDVLQCLLKHWIAVFNEVFPRIEHLFMDLKNTLMSIESKDPKSLSQSEVSNFKELSLEIAKKCQIIPEYMELAKATVERLPRRASDDRTGGREIAVIDAFEGLWTVFSSYCAKLASGLGISHNIEDKLPGDEHLSVLTGKLQLFGTQINSLTLAMKGALSIENGDPSMEEHVARLQMVFQESLSLISVESCLHKDDLRIFCINCRNMLQEAYTKFYELTQLLIVCQNNITNE